MRRRDVIGERRERVCVPWKIESDRDLFAKSAQIEQNLRDKERLSERRRERGWWYTSHIEEETNYSMIVSKEREETL